MKRHPVRKNIRLPLPAYDRGHAFSITIATHEKHPWQRSFYDHALRKEESLNDSPFIFGKTLFVPGLSMNQSNMHGPDRKPGRIGGAFMAGDKPRRYVLDITSLVGAAVYPRPPRAWMAINSQFK
jgi:hypothetical protein